MKNYLEFLKNLNESLNEEILSEQIHQELQSILDSPDISSHDKLDHVVEHVRNMKREGKETGLIGDIPKQGSSRAVFFPKGGKDIILDKKPANIGTALKIAFPGKIESEMHPEPDRKLFGERQNEAEADRLMTHHHGIIRRNDDGTWHTNPEGVIPPLFGAHPEHHYIETARVSPFTEAKFKEATKTPEFKDGITHQEFYDTLMHMHSIAHGKKGWKYNKTDPSLMEGYFVHHPFVRSVQNFSSDSGVHPVDFLSHNIGIWTHPHTGKLHPVLLDYGYRHDIARDYTHMKYDYENKYNIKNSED
ncbi:MAG TPA: hypothetical protein VFM18_09205 [Methanosarcina sp.]|nr:hypothetical protein [Methanosarcina sp.]